MQYIDILKNYKHTISYISKFEKNKIYKKFKTVDNILDLCNLYNRAIQEQTGFHPPEDLNNPNNTISTKNENGIETKLLMPDVKVIFGLDFLNVKEDNFYIDLPPGIKDISYMKFFLVQNYSFTMAMKLNKEPTTFKCSNPNNYDAIIPCIENGKLFTEPEDYIKFLQGEELILEKYLSESVEPKFFGLNNYVDNTKINRIYFNILRNQLTSISKIQIGFIVDSYTLLKYLKEHGYDKKTNYDVTEKLSTFEIPKRIAVEKVPLSKRVKDFLLRNKSKNISSNNINKKQEPNKTYFKTIDNIARVSVPKTKNKNINSLNGFTKNYFNKKDTIEKSIEKQSAIKENSIKNTKHKVKKQNIFKRFFNWLKKLF